MHDSQINILLTGDFCPINRMQDMAIKKDFESIYNDFIDVFQGNDLNIVDLECPLTTAETTRPKTGPYQKALPETIEILKYADVELVAMANNHVMDYSTIGVRDTMELCKKYGIDTVGVGDSASHASKVYSTQIKGKKIAILNYADNEFLSAPDSSYTCNPIDLVECYYDLKKARDEHDFVIVIAHAGNEFYELPSPRTKKLYRTLADMGADVIISHHTHAHSGYEVYHGKPIFYGLGNFLYDWPGKQDSKWNQGYVVLLQLNEKLDFKIIPHKQNNLEPGIFHLNEMEKQDFNRELARLNEVINDDILLEAEFQKYCASVQHMYDAFIEPNFGKVVTALRKRGLLPKLMGRRKRLFLLNLTRCESHRDVLIRMLKENE